jgi:hypothetical protein
MAGTAPGDRGLAGLSLYLAAAGTRHRAVGARPAAGGAALTRRQIPSAE